MTKRLKIYWITQFAGWSIWLTEGLVGYLSLQEDVLFWTSNFLINVLLSVFLTHQYRQLVKKYGWNSLKYELLMPRILLAAFVMSVIMLPINYYFDRVAVYEILSWRFIFGYLMFWGKPMMIWLMFYHIFHYFEATREIEIEKVRLEVSIRETESKVLRAQLNPHFMFNALNSIRALILEDPNKAQKGITQLSNIFRSSLLADRRKTVSFGEEMRTVDDYLALEKIRYEERLEIRKNIYPDAQPVQVPPMMIQTLVENAIKHGVSKPIKGGFVAIEAKIKNGNFVLSISNTGVLEKTDSGGFGLENTVHRLNLLFGDTASFKIYQASKDVVCAEIIIPQEETKS
jgi:sensor histidine kinase YesM